MLDRFHMLHTELAVGDHSKWRFRPGTFAKLRSLAAVVMLPPDPDYFHEKANLEFYQAIYEMLALDELRKEEEQSGSWTSALGRKLGEVVIFFRILDELKLMEEELSDETPKWLTWSIITLGTMIQQRLTVILLDTDPKQHQDLLNLGKMWGMSDRSWQRNLVGAGSAAKAVQQLHAHQGVRVYLATIPEDAFWRIDILIVNERGQGGCINIKTVRGGRTDFFTRVRPAVNGDKDEWQGTMKGTDNFNRVFRRAFEPILLFVGRNGGGLNDLKGVPRRPPSWVNALVEFLQGPRPLASVRVTA